MAFIGVTKAHGPSPQPTACRSATFNLKWKNYLLHPAHYSFTILAIHAIEYWMANSRMIGYTYLYSDYSNFKSEWHLFRKLGYVLTGTNKLSLQIYAVTIGCCNFNRCFNFRTKLWLYFVYSIVSAPSCWPLSATSVQRGWLPVSMRIQTFVSR